MFLERPLPLEIVLYCTQDVLYMPHLLLSYARRLHPGLASQIQSETVDRILLSQSPHFNGEGKHMVCSSNLVEHCTLADSATAEPNASEERVTTVVTHPERSTPSAESAVPSISETLSVLVLSEDGLRDSKSNAEDEFGAAVDRSGTLSQFQGDSVKDFTACDSDYGWCGHYDY